MAIKKITSEEIIESALNFIKEKGYEVTTVSDLIYKNKFIINSNCTQICE